MLHSFQFAIGSILIQGIVDDGIISAHIFLLNEYAFYFHFDDGSHSFFIQYRISFHHNIVSLDTYYLTGIFIHKIFYPGS